MARLLLNSACRTVLRAAAGGAPSPAPRARPRTVSWLAGLNLKAAKHMSTVPQNDYVFRQLFDNTTYTYTYLLGDKETKDAVLIDPVLELVDRDLQLVHDLNLHLQCTINTHVHADHVTGSGEIRRLLPWCQIVISEPAATADVHVCHGDPIKFGRFELECRHTPGHTNGCMTFVWHEKSMAFTGDALLIRGCGRTDFQQGSAEELHNSVHTQIYSLPNHFLLFPGHDYTGQTMSTVAEEKKCNNRLNKTKEQFTQVMDNLNLPYPKQIDRALPANMVSGIKDPPKP